MNYTAKELRQIADAVEANSAGKPVEQLLFGKKATWEPLDANGIKPMVIGGARWLYRPKPEPISRPWSKPDDVPLNCWLRYKDRNHDYASLEAMVLSVSDKGFEWHTNEYKFVSWSNPDAIAKIEYSIDRKTWQPCTVTEG